MLNVRNENETFYQNNGVELSDEALANVVGGCGDNNDCNGGWDNGNGDCNGWGNDNGRGRHCRHHGLLGDLLGDLL